jgi:predicted enzyme related to lactoylglutathione lyase
MKKNPVVHFEMPFKDKKRLVAFYSKVFGWQMQQMGADMGEYVLATTTETENGMVKTPGNINGGFFKLPDKKEDQIPSVVIAVDDIKAHMKLVEKAGGKVLDKPAMIPGVGWYTSFRDTEGNRVSLLQPVGM